MIRRSLREDLRSSGLGDPRVGDVVLMTSELVTNALVHAHSTAEVSIERDGNVIRVGVADNSPSSPVMRSADPRRVGGNGMRIVEALADAWGTISRPTVGKEVWFSVGA